MKSLTRNLEAKMEPYLRQRDDPKSLLPVNHPDYLECTCCFCEQRFLEGDIKWGKTNEHLDNNRENNKPWNIAKAHRYCNEKKRYDSDLQIIASELIERNKKYEDEHPFESARERNKTQPIDEQTEIDLNVAHHEIAENFLHEKIIPQYPRYLLSDSINCIVLRCRKQTGHGSAQAIRNYINVLACTEGKYQIEKIEGKNYVQKRIKKKLPDTREISKENNS